MIGFYVHHHGAGHQRRAALVARALADEPVVGFGSSPAPAGWPGRWVRLPPDDDAACRREGADPTAGGTLHWVPTADGVRRRAATIASLLDRHRPRLVVVDVSVEATLLVRLHGIRVLVVAQPGVRDDPAHALAQRAATTILAPWPAWVGDRPWRPVRGVSAVPVGAIGATPAARSDPAQRDPAAVAVLVGRGGHAIGPGLVEDLVTVRPDRTFHLLGDLDARPHPNVLAHGWVEDVECVLRQVGVVITHVGQTAIATVASTRTPAVLVPQPRPFGEQESLARVLHEEGLATAVDGTARADELATAIDGASALGGEQWARWDDGLGPRRAAALIAEVAREAA